MSGAGREAFVEQYARKIKTIAGDMRESETWRECAEDFGVQAATGAAAGAVLSWLLVRRHGFGRGLVLGTSLGAGLGSAYVRCDERFIAAQTKAFAGPLAPGSGVTQGATGASKHQ